VTDEEQLGALLTLATALPDDVQPPVSQLISRGRRRQRLRTSAAVAAVAVVALAAAGLPPIIRAIGAGHSLAGRPVTRPTRSLGGPATPRPSGLPSPGPSKSALPSPGPTQPELFRYHWARLAPSPLGPRQPDIVTWAGRDLLEIGGAVGGKPSKTGAAFNPASERWHPMAPVPFDVNVAFATYTWTGRQLFVTDGRSPRCKSYPATRAGAGKPVVCEPHAGLYDPVTNRWTTTQLPTQMYGLPSMTSTWTGRDVILAGVTLGTRKLEVAAYDPAAGRWTMITPGLPARHTPSYAAVAATSSRVVIWVPWTSVQVKPRPSIRFGTDVLAMGGDGRWQNVTGTWPQRQTVTEPVFNGTEFLIPTSEHRCVTPSCPVSRIYPGAFADPGTLRRTLIPFSPIDALQPSYIAAGQETIEMETSGGATLPGGHRVRQDETVAFDWMAGWRHLPAPPGRPQFAAIPVWTGSALLALTEKGDLFALRS
jgi:hypothetical protein